MKDYEGSVYIGIVGGDHDYPTCRDSIQALNRGPKDDMCFMRSTKGYEARQIHLNQFMESKHDFMFLMDHDQVFPADALDRLRAHKIPYVSGYYMRRRNNPITPVWFKWLPKNKFPQVPWVGDPERGKLHKLGASGWGCLLVHREVIEAMQPILKGEPEIIEDDLDVWPYDLGVIMAALKALGMLVEENPPEEFLKPSLKAHVQALQKEIRPLLVDKSVIVGSDIRFPFYAREAGYTLMGDPDCRCAHILDYALTPDDYASAMAVATPEAMAGLRKMIGDEVKRDAERVRAAWVKMDGGK